AIVIMTVEATEPSWFMVALHLVLFFAAAMVCHSELAKDRPPTARLTEFYLCLSIGGVMGGIMNALLAPLIFSRVWEYPLVMLLACAIRPVSASRSNWKLLYWPLGVGVLM